MQNPLPEFLYRKNCITRFQIKTRSRKEEVIGEDRFGFRKARETGDAIWMLRIISERLFGFKDKCVSSISQEIS